MSAVTLVRALGRDAKLKDAYVEYVAGLEEAEREAWAKYSRLSHTARMVRAAHEAKRATKADVKIAGKRATRAHLTHQRILSEIGLVHRLYIGWRAGRG